MQFEIVSVRLISLGTSAIVTARSTYFSGGSVIFDIALSKAAIADAVAVNGHGVATCDPFPAYIAAVRLMDIRFFAVWTNA